MMGCDISEEHCEELFKLVSQQIRITARKVMCSKEILHITTFCLNISKLRMLTMLTGFAPQYSHYLWGLFTKSQVFNTSKKAVK